jgi:hypothetical protein
MLSRDRARAMSLSLRVRQRAFGGWPNLTDVAKSVGRARALTADPDPHKLRWKRTLMQRLRTIRRFIRVLVGVFVVAQFAGVVASPLASAEAFATAVTLHADHEHAHHHHGDEGGRHQSGQGADHADRCCALHAFFAGVLPPVIAVEIGEADSQRLAPYFADIGVGVDLGRLDRPPRPLHVI